MHAHPDVVILGAGFAGLACATALAGAGARVTVLEASGTPGGRGGSFREPRTGEILDLGPHLLVGANRDARALLERLGTLERLEFQRSLNIEYRWRGDRRSRLSCPPLPAPFHLAAGLLRFQALPLSERAAAVRIGRAVRRIEKTPGRFTASPSPRNGQCPTPEETVTQWLKRLRQGEHARHLLWEPLATAALNDHPGRASAFLFARVLAEVFSGGPRDSALGWPRGALGDLLKPADRWLEQRGGSLSYSSPAAGLVWKGSHVQEVRLRGGGSVRSGQVVSALPARALLPLLADAPASVGQLRDDCRLFAPRTLPILSVYFWSERRLLGTPFCALPEEEFPWIFERRALAEGSRGSWILALTLGGAQAWMNRPEAAILEASRRQMEGLFPGSERDLWHARVVRQPEATFEPAPDLCLRRPGPGTPADNLWLAGDWTNTGLPSTLEGAARSGHIAARALESRA